MSNDKPNGVTLNDRTDNDLRSPTAPTPVKENDKTQQAKVTRDITTSNETEAASLRKVTLINILNYYNYNLTTTLCTQLEYQETIIIHYSNYYALL